LRERFLASDQRAGAWPRSKARREQRSYVRQHWGALGGVGALALTGPMLALPFVDSGFVRGLLTGVACTAVVGSLAFWVVQVTGTASVMMGDLGEQWTASELRKLRRHGWRVVNHVRLREWDIDHVLVGPGGVFAASCVQHLPSRMNLLGTQHVRRQLRAPQLGVRSCHHRRGGAAVDRHINRNASCPGTPEKHHCFDLTYPQASKVRPQAEVPGVLSSLTDGRKDAVIECIESPSSCAPLRLGSATDSVDRAKHPMPPSVAELAVRLVVAVAAGTAGFLVAAQAASALAASGWWLVVCAGLLLPGLALHRLGHARYAAWGWLLGVGSMVVLTVLVVVRRAVM
jgi:hypothetical protein